MNDRRCALFGEECRSRKHTVSRRRWCENGGLPIPIHHVFAGHGREAETEIVVIDVVQMDKTVDIKNAIRIFGDRGAGSGMGDVKGEPILWRVGGPDGCFWLVRGRGSTRTDRCGSLLGISFTSGGNHKRRPTKDQSTVLHFRSVSGHDVLKATSLIDHFAVFKIPPRQRFDVRSNVWFQVR